ncbi:hypothetical protein Tco_0856510 [Tanacetum coccineum]|uniref:Uncharacterized protein n=1 Tax=Tanacetum coccineum TaxID=301880 RepID=A0ABQ5B7G4_9ASTR
MNLKVKKGDVNQSNLMQEIVDDKLRNLRGKKVDLGTGSNTLPKRFIDLNPDPTVVTDQSNYTFHVLTNINGGSINGSDDTRLHSTTSIHSANVPNEDDYDIWFMRLMIDEELSL